MTPYALSLLLIIFLLTITYSCSDSDIGSPEVKSSFGLIQEKILNTSCALSGCHASENDYVFAQHKLILKEGVAYENLVNADAQNEQAKIDGLKRVNPGKPNESLLIHKLHCDNGHHTKDYGNQMPLGMDALSDGQIEFIIQWIAEGASKDAIISANSELLNDLTPGCQEEFEQLEAPKPGEGYQVIVESFDVASNFERELFVYKEVGNETPIYVNKIEMKMRKNSHHFLINTFSEDTPPGKLPLVNVIRDLRDTNNNYIMPTVAQMEFQIPTIASQTPLLEYHFPPGVALKMPANHKIDINLHYVNKTTSTFQGECYVNFFTTNAGDVQHEAQSLFFSNEDIFLPPNQKTVVIKNFNITAPTKIFMLTSHTHKLSERFEIQVVGGPQNGEIIYSSSDWHHPAIKTFDVPIELTAGQSLKMIVTYNNTTSKTIKFGLTSEDEMSIIYGYYF